MARKVEVEIVGDSRSLERAFKRSEKAATTFTATIGRSFRGAFTRLSSLTPALIGAAGFVAAAKYAIGAASDLHEQLSFTGVVFGESAKQVDSWSQSVTSSFGVARREALQMASAFGVMFEEAGATQTQAARMSETMVQLAGDMASATNQSPSEMLQRLQSALAGEAEPLRRFGVFISDAATKSEAYRDGIAKVGTELTDNQKILARYNFILGHTGKMQGDFSRTSQGLANLQRALRGQIDALATSLGAELLPYVQAITGWLVKWLGDTRNQARMQQWFRNILIAVGSAIDYVIKTFGPFVAVAGKAAETVISQWEGVKAFFRTFFIWLQYAGLKAFRKLIEPLSHIPSGGFIGKHVLGKGIVNVGKWARETKDIINEMLPDLEQRAATRLQGGHGRKSFGERIRDFAKGLKLPGVKPLSQIIKEYQGSLTTTLGVHAKTTDILKKAVRGRRGVTADQRNRWFDDMISRQLDILEDYPLRRQISALKKIAGMIQQRINVTKDITRKLTLEDQLRHVLREKRQKQSELDKQSYHRARYLTSEQVLASFGLKLGPQQERRMLQMVAQYGRGWSLPAGHTPAFAGGGVRGGVVVHGDVHVHGVQDIGKLENQLTKRAKARAQVRRGT